jgi:hypothetical protein
LSVPKGLFSVDLERGKFLDTIVVFLSVQFAKNKSSEQKRGFFFVGSCKLIDFTLPIHFDIITIIMWDSFFGVGFQASKW